MTRWARQHPYDPSAAGVPLATQAGWYLPSFSALGAALLIVVLAVIAIAVVLNLGRRIARSQSPRRWWPIGAAVAPVSLAVVLGTGVYGMSQTIGGVDSATLAQSMRYFVSRAAYDGTLPVTQDLVDGGRWLQAHAGPDDVVAVNRYCVETRAWRAGRARCDAREFSPAALSQRRSYVGGWAYADRILAQAWSQPPPYSKIPFWDPARLEAQDQAFQKPTSDGLNALYADGVRWLWADVRDGPVAVPELDRLAALRYSGTNLRIWQLRVPKG